MYSMVNVQAFIYSTLMTSVGAVIHDRGAYKNGALIRIQALIGIGAVIDKNTVKGGAYSKGGA